MRRGGISRARYRCGVRAADDLVAVGTGARLDHEQVDAQRVEVIRDVDFLATVAQSVPAEVEALVARTGIRPEDVAGKVHSVTYRARKLSAS